jgi:hypothetical protein
LHHLLLCNPNLEIRRAELIHLDIMKFTRRYLTLEQDIHLAGAEALWFWKTIVGPDPAKCCESTPHKAAFPAEVPRRWVEDRVVEEIGGNAHDVIAVSGEGHGLDPETGGGQLGDEAVADWSYGYVEGEDEEVKKSGGGISDGVRGFWDTQKADDDEDCEHGRQTIEIELAPPHELHDEPSTNGAKQTDAVAAEAEAEGLAWVEARLLQEIDHIRKPDTACNLVWMTLVSPRPTLMHQQH